MAINKNFVVKNGLEVSGNLIFANATDKKVGIGTTNSQFTLGVHGGIGVTDLYVSDGATILGNFDLGSGGEFLKLDSSTGMIGIGTDNPQYLLDLRSNVSTGQTAFYVKGDADITGTCKTQKLESIDLDVSGAVSFNNANFTSVSITSGATFGPNSNLEVNGTSSFAKDASFSQDVNIADDLTVAGSVDITTNMVVDGTATIAGDLSVISNLNVDTNLNISGTSLFSGDANFATQLITGSANSVVSTSEHGTYIGDGIVVNTIQPDSTQAAVERVFLGKLANDTKSEIFKDGSAAFAGTVDADGVKIGAGIVTASTNSGIVTYYGDGANLINVSRGVAIEANGTSIGTEIQTINFSGTPVSTANSSASSGVAEINFEVPPASSLIATSTSDNVEMKPILKGSDDTPYYSDLLQYNPSTGKLSTTEIAGNITGGTISGTDLTATGTSTLTTVNISGDVQKGGRAIPYSVVSNIAPVTRANGDFWTDTSVTPSILKVWTGSEWTETGSGDVSELTDSNGDIRVGVTTTGAALTGDVLINWDSTDNESGVMIGEMDTPEVDANGNVIKYSSIVVGGRGTENIAFGTYDGVANKYTTSIWHSGYARFKQIGINTGNNSSEDGSINLFRYEKDENDTIVSDNQIQVVKSRDRESYPVIYSTILESDSTTKTEYMVRANGNTEIGMDTTDYKKGLLLMSKDTSGKSAIYIHGDGSSTGTALGVYNGTSQKYIGGINHDGNVYGERATITTNANIGGLTVGRGNGTNSSTAALGYNALNNNTGNWNIGIGNQALTNNTVGTSNVAIGDGAMRDNKASSNCVAIGGGAGRYMTDTTTAESRQNTYVGHFAGAGTESSVTTNTGKWNTSVGANSLLNITTGNENACYGLNSGSNITTGSYNACFGTFAGRGTDSGDNTPRPITGEGNAAFGRSSLYSLKTGGYNTSIGSWSMYENDDGGYNTAVGYQSLYYNRGRSQGTAVGYYSQRNCDSTDAEEINFNVSVGAWALTGSDSAGSNTGNYNVAMGYSAGYLFTTGEANVSIGMNCMRNMTTASSNTAVGYRAQYNTTIANWNTSIGYYALHDAVSAENCTAIGYYALKANTANENTACGSYALSNTVSGTYNTAVGRIAGRDVNSDYNTCIGYAAGYQIQTGGNNTAIGALAGMGISSGGNQNVAVGSNTQEAKGEFDGCVSIGVLAGYQNKGNYNVSVGLESLRNHNQTGDMYNTAIGTSSGKALTSGNQNVFLGAWSGNGVNQNNVVCLGFNTAVAQDNVVLLGNSSQTSWSWGSVVDVSDERDKTDIRDTILGLDFIKSLRPVDFRWDYREDYYEYDSDGNRIGNIDDAGLRKDGSKKRTRFHHGLIAQELKETLDSTGVDFGGYKDQKVNGGQDQLGIGYEELFGPMIKSIQELSAENEALKEKLEDVMARLDAANI